MADEHKLSMMRHWPTLFLGLLVAVIFIVAVFSFQVKSTDVAIVTTFGRITRVFDGADAGDAGLKFRWPYPIQSVYAFDNRLRCFEGTTGKMEETLTRDAKNILVGIYITYRISNPKFFFTNIKDIKEAEESLNSFMRSAKVNIIGQYDFNQFVNVDPAKVKLADIERGMLKEIAERAENQCGITVETVGVKVLGLPQDVTAQVFERMKKERNVVAQDYRSKGESEAAQIRTKARNEQALTLAEAEAEAQRIRAEGDAKAAEYYAAFRKSPKLAAFLRKLESLRRIMKNKTTLILDTDSPPFDLLETDIEAIEPATIPVKKK